MQADQKRSDARQPTIFIRLRRADECGVHGSTPQRRGM